MKGTNTKGTFVAVYINPKARHPSDALQKILKKAKNRDSVFMGDINADYMKWKTDEHGNYEPEDRKTTAKAKRMKNMLEANEFKVCNDNGVPTSVVRERPSRVIDVIATNMKTERVTSEVSEGWKPTEREDEMKTREMAIRKGAKKARSERNRMYHRPVHTKMEWVVQRTREQNRNTQRKNWTGLTMKNEAHKRALKKATRAELEKMGPTPGKDCDRETAIEWMENFSEALCAAKRKAQNSLSDKQKRADNRKIKWPRHWDQETKELARRKERLREKFLRMRKAMREHDDVEEKTARTLKEMEGKMKNMKKIK